MSTNNSNTNGASSTSYAGDVKLVSSLNSDVKLPKSSTISRDVKSKARLAEGVKNSRRVPGEFKRKRKHTFVKTPHSSPIQRAIAVDPAPEVSDIETPVNGTFADISTDWETLFDEEEAALSALCNRLSTSNNTTEANDGWKIAEVECDLSWYPGASKISKPVKHKHPTLHFGRQWGEGLCYNYLRNMNCNVVDIGGTLKRHSQYERKLHSYQPIVFDNDLHKNRSDLRRVNQGLTMCECAKLTPNSSFCKHILGTQQPGFMLVDVVYYLEPSVIADLVSLGPVVATCHLFEQPFGNFCDEAYYIADKDIIEMRVNGHKTVYRHNNCHWLFKPTLTPKGWLVSTIEEIDPYRSLVYFSLTKEKPVCFEIPDKLVLELEEKTPPSAIMSVGANTLTRTVELGIWGDYYVGPLGYMSQHAYNAVKAYIAGRPRTSVTLTSCFHISREAHKRIVGLPPSWVPLSEVMAGVLGFCAHVKEEKHLVSYQMAVSNNDRVVHSQALKDNVSRFDVIMDSLFGQWTVNKFITVMVIALLCSVGIGILAFKFVSFAMSLYIQLGSILFSFIPKQLFLPLWPFLGVDHYWTRVLFAPLAEEMFKRIFGQLNLYESIWNVRQIVIVVVCYLFALLENGTDTWTKCMKTLSGTCLHLVLLHLPLPIAVLFHGLYNYYNLPLLNVVRIVESNFNIEHLSTEVEGIINEKLLLYSKTVPLPPKPWRCIFVGDLQTKPEQPIDHIGLAFADRLPIVHDTNAINELAAIENRIFGNPLVPKLNKLNDFNTYIKNHYKTVINMPYCPRDQLFDSHDNCYRVWNDVRRFGAVNSRIHDDANIELDCGFETYHHARTLFVKKEKKNSSTILSFDLGDPRAIQSVSAAVHTCLGPFIYAFAKVLALEWNGYDCLLYASGLNGLQMFQLLRLYPVYFVGDISRFDRSIHATTMSVLNSFKYELCVDHHIKECLDKQLFTKGTSMKGKHKYAVQGQRKSGDANTSVDNSIINAFLHIYAICFNLRVPIQHVLSNYQIMVLGDDIVIGGPKELQTVDFRTCLCELGYISKPKIVKHIFDVEFCSKIFWHTATGGVLATKPGRFFARVGFSHLPKCPVPFSSICSGLYVDNSVVPFVRVYLQRFRHEKPHFERNTCHNECVVEPDSITYSQFEYLYGLTRNHEMEFEEWLQDWHGGPAFASHPYITILMDRDC